MSLDTFEGTYGSSVSSPATTDHLLPLANSSSLREKPSKRRLVSYVTLFVPARITSFNTLTFFCLTCVWVISYKLSLQGGDLLFINNNLGLLGGEILISVVSLTSIVTMLYMRKLRRTLRRNVAVLLLVIATALYVYDHGERFEEHGFYNVLVFLAIFIPLNVVIATTYVLFMTIPNFIVILVLSLVGLACGVTLALRHYIGLFDQGMFDRLQDIPGECKWQGSNYPLVDLLPSGTQNFWAGSMSCKPSAGDIKADFDAQGYLTASCSTGDAITVDILPDTRRWMLKDKSKWQIFNHRVLDAVVHSNYTKPMLVDEQIQAVVVRCGAQSKIVTRVSPPPSRIPEFVPPANTDTRSEKARDKITGKRPNVIFLFVDAVSHRQFYRRLEKSAAVLKTLHQPGKTRLTELYRYHSLGVSTDNSTKAMYIGAINPERVNPLPIWAYYRDRGYVTARVETSCEDWSTTYISQYHRSKKYSIGERSLDYELSSPFCMPEFYPATGNSFGNFKGPFSIIARCLYGRHVHEYGFDYINQLRHELRSVEQSRRRPYMMMLNLMEGHEGTGEVLRTLDNRLSVFLEDLRTSGELEDTALFLLSDHGLHM
ncbi:hypothetical protein LPJ57_006993, partial [Coemansia sp. RSA 486]